MDPINVIISALTVGATTALQETAGKAIKDAYKGLAVLVKRKFMRNSPATVALEGHAKDPETWQKPLEKSLRESGVADDQEILMAAQKLLELVQSQQSSPKYDVDIRGNVQGFVQGDHATVTMNFDESAQKQKKPKKL